MSESIVLTGDLSEIRLPTLLTSLYRDRETGILTITEPRCVKRLYIRDGSVVYATSTDPDDRLGECLLRRGLITLQQYQESAVRTGQGHRQGQALVDMGAVDPAEMVENVTQQIYDIMFSLFRVRAGTYSLELTAFSTMDMITLSIEIPVVIFRGMSRITSWNQMKSMVGDLSLRFHTRADQPSFVDGLDLTADQDHILKICKEGLPLESILQASYLSQFDTLRLLWIYLTLDMMEREENPRSREPRDPEALIERYNDLYSYVHQSMSAQPTRLSGLPGLLQNLETSFPVLARGQQDLVSFGKLDVDAVLFALRALPEDRRMTGLQSFLEETLYALVLEADERLSAPEREKLHDYLRRQAGEDA